MDLNFNATLAAQVFHFILLLVLLRIFAYRPLLQVLDDRRKLVEEQVNAAERDRGEARELRLKREEALEAARKQAAQIIARAEAEAVSRAREIIDEARGAAEAMKNRAAVDIDREREEARSLLHKELAGLVLLSTEKVVGRMIDDPEHRRLVEEAVGEVGARRCRIGE